MIKSLLKETYGSGTEIITSCNSKSVSRSYSILRSHVPSPAGEGQQFTINLLKTKYAYQSLHIPDNGTAVAS